MSTLVSGNLPDGSATTNLPSPATEGNQVTAGTYPTSFGSGLFTFSHVAVPYSTWTQKIKYIWDNGTIQIPLAGLGNIANGNVMGFNQRQASKAVQLCSPFGKKIVKWSASRRGATPILPHPIPFNDPNSILKKATIDTISPALETDAANHMFMITGTYIYILLQPLWAPTDTLTMGATAYDLTPAAANLLVPGAFVQGSF
jgi:hypothetical protein